MWARIHLIPALQAEEDRDQVRRYLADKAREKELLGTETRVYNSDRYMSLHLIRYACLTYSQVCTTDIRYYPRKGIEVEHGMSQWRLTFGIVNIRRVGAPYIVLRSNAQRANAYANRNAYPFFIYS